MRLPALLSLFSPGGIIEGMLWAFPQLVSPGSPLLPFVVRVIGAAPFICSGQCGLRLETPSIPAFAGALSRAA